MKLKLGDKVIVTTGKDKGKQGEIERVIPKKNMVVVNGINQAVRHIKPQGGQAGDRKTITKPIHMSKVAIVNDAGKADRVGIKVGKDGSKVRIFKKTNKAVPEPAVKTTKKAKK